MAAKSNLYMGLCEHMAHQNLTVYQNFIIYHLKDIYIYIWLVVSTPLKHISQLGLLFPIYGKIKHVPNHQPYIYIYPIFRDIQMSTNRRFRQLNHVSFRKMQNQTDEATYNKCSKSWLQQSRNHHTKKTWHCDLSACKWCSAATGRLLPLLKTICKHVFLQKWGIPKSICRLIPCKKQW